MTGAYSLRVTFVNCDVRTIEASDNPTTARDAHNRVSRNPKVVRLIQLWDLTGPLELIWSNQW